MSSTELEILASFPPVLHGFDSLEVAPAGCEVPFIVY